MPALVVPDLLSAVTKACRYEPRLNTSYYQMLAHYGTAALPARPYQPRDKAKVEVALTPKTKLAIGKQKDRLSMELSQ